MTGKCKACERERKTRQGFPGYPARGEIPGYPADFQCQHPDPAGVDPSSYPRTYVGKRVCPMCRGNDAVDVKVHVFSAWKVSYECLAGHRWAPRAVRWLDDDRKWRR